MNSLTIYKSSAGSGKTFTLVLEYLKLIILNPYRYSNILAVTFTNAATNEMKKRIIQQLMELATSSEEEQRENIVFLKLEQHFQENHIELSHPIDQQARRALDNILNDYSNFSVSTIERFFQRIVRAFTRELNIPMGYEIEMQQAQVLEYIIGDMLLEVGTNKDLTNLLKQFLDYNLSEDKSWNIHLMLRKLGSQVFKEQFQQLNVQKPLDTSHIQHIQEIAGEIIRIRREFEQHMCSLANEAISILNRFDLPLDAFKYKKSSVPSYFYRVQDKLDFDPKKRAREGCEELEAWMKPGSEREEDFYAAIQAGLIDWLNEMVSYYDEGIDAYQTALTVSGSIYSFGVMYDLQQKLSDYRKEYHQLIISDTSYLLSMVLDGGTDPPFIYERVGTRYMHYLLDEFQDTSDMQWSNLFPLLREAMSQSEPDAQPHNLIVGDVKQSIYRWRNGNMDLLNRKVEQQVQSAFGERPREEFLTDNWRTAKDVVEFNNTFFQHSVEYLGKELDLEEGSDLHQAYRNIVQHSTKNHIRGFVGIEFFEHEKRISQPEGVSWIELAMGRTLELIQELMDEGFKESDITLLVRRNSEGIQLAQFLQKNRVKVVSAESLLLMRNDKVILILAYLKYLVFGDDEIAEATLQYHLSQMNGELQTDHLSFLSGIGKRLLVEIFASREQLLRMPVYDCISYLIHRLRGLHEPDAYVLSFLGAVLEYTQLQDSSITGFLDWWEDQKSSRAIASVDEQDAVRIMTIHKSKGLEFPVVILPFADWSLKPKVGDFIWIEKPDKAPYDQFEYLPVKVSSKLDNSYFKDHYRDELIASYIDNLNLLYVAFTRSEHRLYILTKDYAGKAKQISQVAHLINFVIREGMNMATNEEKMITWGKKESYERKTRDLEQETVTLKTLEHAGLDHQPRISIRFSSNMYLPTDIRQRSEQILAGELVHEALAHIYSVEDITVGVKHVLHKGLISSEESDFMEKLLQEVVLHPDAAHWFSGLWEVKNEAEILYENSTILRPDRVMIHKGKAVVVDYKTGDPYVSHHIQVQKYMYALKTMGYILVEGYVYYLLKHIEKVSDSR